MDMEGEWDMEDLLWEVDITVVVALEEGMDGAGEDMGAMGEDVEYKLIM